MQIAVNLPDTLVDKLEDKWGDLSRKILKDLVLSAFRDGLIDLDELKEMLDIGDEAGLKAFFIQNNMLHSSGLINLSGSCADRDFDDGLGISDKMDDDMMGVFDE
ncbi:MAG: hypothetical protein HC849_12555 [Oscillatoriales cyanobacterium RU_3_3]|nr:hypothetical protein [Microcoleus sp. SM1_3_4]NJM60852.1 hypothetical protein [Oscillatoriales cyanobacterium RU_3_3]NJR24021.1 hypothetical protein [Richelia sp. CSU_2_1]